VAGFSQAIARVRRAIYICAIVVAMSGIARTAGAESPLEVPAILPLTGANAFAGGGQRTALLVLQGLVNRGGGIGGRSLVFDIHDSQSNSAVAVELTREYVNGRAPVFIGDSSNATCTAIAAQVAQTGPVQFCLSPGLVTKPDGFSFAPGHPATQIAGGVLGYLRERGIKRVALIVATDATGLQMDGYFTDLFARPENRDISLVANERFGPNDLSVSAQIARIKATAAQALISYTSGAPFGTVMHGLIDVGLNVPVITSQGNLSYAFLEQFKPLLPKALLFVSGPLPSEGERVADGPFKSTQLAYLAAFHAAGVKPDFGEAVAWDAGSIIVAALRRLGAHATAEQVREYVHGLHDFPGVQGLYDFRSGDGHGAPMLSMLQWDPVKDAWFIVSGVGARK
jgi:branched-chain amino acid transport system substrate-binding protein